MPGKSDPISRCMLDSNWICDCELQSCWKKPQKKTLIFSQQWWHNRWWIMAIPINSSFFVYFFLQKLPTMRVWAWKKLVPQPQNLLIPLVVFAILPLKMPRNVSCVKRTGAAMPCLVCHQWSQVIHSTNICVILELNYTSSNILWELHNVLVHTLHIHLGKKYILDVTFGQVSTFLRDSMTFIYVLGSPFFIKVPLVHKTVSESFRKVETQGSTLSKNYI